MRKILNEFKTFAVKGSAIDLAVGIIIGAAFNSIVRSLVDDIIMPPIGFLLGGVDFREFFIALGSERYETLNEAKEAGVATINYGVFINALISFVITAAAVFFLVKMINLLRESREKDPKPTPTTRSCPFCFTEIPRKATKCPACTSEVSPVAEEKKKKKAEG